MRAALLALAGAGCLQPAGYFDALRDAHADPDGDGWTAAQGDCAPHDPARAPRLPERCDGEDNDCDGQVDEDPVDAEAWFDGDRDGYGDPAAAVVGCAPPEGFVAAGAPDCDDDAALTHPDADERCDGADNDCDGLVDEDPAVDAPTWTLDVDGDGYGNNADAVTSCAPPSEEWALQGDDCAPEDPEIYPGASEVCNGEDDDCDGLADNPPVSDDTLWYPDADRDGFGDAGADGLCAPEPGWVSNNLDCADLDAAVKPGAVEVCNDGVDNDCSGAAEGCGWPAEVALDDARLLSPGVPDGFGFGSGLEVADVTGDGHAELLVGEYQGRHPSGGPVGAVHVYALPLAPDGVRTPTSSWRAARASLELFGSDLSAADFDGDGFQDLAISSMAAASGARGDGAVFVGYGPLPTGTAIEDSFDAQVFHSGAWTDLFGRDVWSGDVLGDGLPAVVIGASADGGGSASGSIFVWAPRAARVVDAEADARAILRGDSGSELGWCVTGIDLNGDGVLDLVGGAPGHGGAGAALIFWGPVAGVAAAGDADAVVVGRRGGAQLGKGCAALGDSNGDGTEDLGLGAPGDQYGWAGVFAEGLPAGEVAASSATAQVLGTRSGAAGGFGTSVHAAGDLNQDGALDLIVGEVQEDPLAARAWFGPLAGTHDDADADLTLWVPDAGATGYLRQLRGGADLTGDTVPDLLIADEIRDEGRVWLVPGVGF